VDKWDTKHPTIQVTVADTGDAKAMFTFNRRLTDPQWKYQPVNSKPTSAKGESPVE
jgi:hypothetical protein